MLPNLPGFKKRDKKGGAPRWMVTFADIMSLLFAMVILILSFADFRPDKFTHVAGPMRHAFHIVEPVDQRQVVVPLEQLKEETPVEVSEWKNNTLYQVRAALSQEIKDATAEVEEKNREVVIRFPDRTAFASGSQELQPGILPVLDKVADILKRVEGQVLVSGHTDDIPISTAQFRSNWDLSAGRAVSVVHHLVERNRIPPERITAQGFAESRPLAPNDSPEGRSRNRRVEVSIGLPSSIEARLKPTFGP